MKAHIIENGRVKNTIEIESIDAVPGLNLVPASLGGAIGDTYDPIAGTFTPPAPVETPVEVPQEVSRRRGLEALFRQHGLTLADIQTKIREVITDPDEQYLALNDLETSQTFERHRARVIQIGAAFGLDLDALFIYAASLP